MGTRTLEAKLTTRLLAVLFPALVAVGAASVALAWWALDAADTDAARAQAGSALAAMRTELNEPDPFDRAAGDALEAMDAVGAAALLRDLGTGRVYATKRVVPPALAAQLEARGGGACLSGRDAAGEHWRACTAHDERVEVVGAVDVTSHARVVETVAEGVSLGIALALAAAAMAARTSLRGALASVRALVRWSQAVVDVDDVPPAPAADTAEIASLGSAFDAVVRRLVDAGVRARATSENIAHELRTPLTTIRAELDALAASSPEVLRADGKDAVEKRAVVDRMRADIERLARVVDAILILAVPPSGPQARASDCVVNLADVARDLAPAETRVEAPDEALVVAEPRLVELAIANLLENARKHTGREARTIRVARAGDVARVAVIDDGPGLDDEARARMFDRYWRGSRDGGGTGLGLALVRAVARRYGGEADARVAAEGSGLEVALTFGRIVGWHEA